MNFQPPPATRLKVFLKAPRAGLVKTRLAASVGHGPAAAIYRRLLLHLLLQLRPIPAIDLVFAPPDARPEIEPWRLNPAWNCLPQTGGDLGSKLAAAFQEAFDQGVGKVAIIGSDCPFATPGDVEAAWAGLEEHDLVLGPAEDGGYWLVALRAPHPPLFEGIAWSTGRVMEQTLARASRLGLKSHLLRSLPDVDTLEDWRRVEAQIPEIDTH